MIDPHPDNSDNSSSDGDSGGEDVGENSDDNEGDEDRGGDDETMVITFEDPGDSDDHDEHGDNDDEEDEDEDDDDDDDDDDDEEEEEDEISSVNRPEGLIISVVNVYRRIEHCNRIVKGRENYTLRFQDLANQNVLSSKIQFHFSGSSLRVECVSKSRNQNTRKCISVE